MPLPKDPYMLLSTVNTLLRDHYPSFSAFCEDRNADSGEISAVLASIGYQYHPELNQFR